MADEVKKIESEVPAAQRKKFREAVGAGLSKARAALKARTERQLTNQWKPGQNTLASFIGGGLAEANRRKGVGRFTVTTRGQALALTITGYAVQKGGEWLGVPYVGPVGSAHAALAGAVASTELYGSKDQPDPVKVAYEGTTHKALNPATT